MESPSLSLAVHSLEGQPTGHPHCKARPLEVGSVDGFDLLKATDRETWSPRSKSVLEVQIDRRSHTKDRILGVSDSGSAAEEGATREGRPLRPRFGPEMQSASLREPKDRILGGGDFEICIDIGARVLVADGEDSGGGRSFNPIMSFNKGGLIQVVGGPCDKSISFDPTKPDSKGKGIADPELGGWGSRSTKPSAGDGGLGGPAAGLHSSHSRGRGGWPQGVAAGAGLLEGVLSEIEVVAHHKGDGMHLLLEARFAELAQLVMHWV